MQLKVKYLFDNLPELASDPLDSGFDVRAAVDHPVKIEPMGRETIPTGIAVEIDLTLPHNAVKDQLKAFPLSLGGNIEGQTVPAATHGGESTRATRMTNGTLDAVGDNGMI